VGLLICATVAALIGGWATGGRLERLALVPLRGWPTAGIAIAAVVLGAALGNADGQVGHVAAVGGPVFAAGCLALLLVRNRSVEGVPLLALGLLLNAVVVGANGAMPVSSYAEQRAGLPTAALVSATDATHELAGPGTRFRLLGDVVPVPLPARPETVSAGDVLIVAGAALLVVAGMHRRPVETSEASAPASADEGES
jgi:hypothetical protein